MAGEKKGHIMKDIRVTTPIDFEDPEAGMATAEYAVGTVAATSFAGILLWLFEQEWFKEMIADLFKNLFSIF